MLRFVDASFGEHRPLLGRFLPEFLLDGTAEHDRMASVHD